MERSEVTAALKAGIAKIDEQRARITALQDELAEMRAYVAKMIPANVCLDNHRWPDDTIVPMDVTLGELREARAILSRSGGEK